MANTTYKVIGKQRGSFTDKKDGREVQFRHLFTAQPIVFPADSHAEFDGVKTDKLKASDRAFDRVQVGECYEFFFDKYGAVMMAEPAEDFDSSAMPF